MHLKRSLQRDDERCMSASGVAPLTTPLVGTSVQSVDRLGLMRWVAVSMFAIGGATTWLGVIITETGQSARGWQSVWAVCFLVCALALVLFPPRLVVIQTAVLVSIAVLGGLIATSDPLGMASLFFLWPTVFAAYFFSRRLWIASFLFVAVSLGTGLIINRHLPLKLDTFIGTLASVGLMAALVATMTRRERRFHEALELTAGTDPLTGLLNRRAFVPDLASMILSSRDGAGPLAVVIFDVDHFKRFNDRFGHLLGDQALQQMAQVLREQSRGTDAVCRFGGEEFVVALPDADTEAALAYATRVAGALSHDQSDRRVSTSAGIATLTADSDDAGVMLARADQALYAAKEAGRDRAAWWDGRIHIGEPFR
jgi:diguanylate cyclase (GGDEF)-like protein